MTPDQLRILRLKSECEHHIIECQPGDTLNDLVNAWATGKNTSVVCVVAEGCLHCGSARRNIKLDWPYALGVELNLAAGVVVNCDNESVWILRDVFRRGVQVASNANRVETFVSDGGGVDLNLWYERIASFVNAYPGLWWCLLNTVNRDGIILNVITLLRFVRHLKIKTTRRIINLVVVFRICGNCCIIFERINWTRLFNRHSEPVGCLCLRRLCTIHVNSIIDFNSHIVWTHIRWQISVLAQTCLRVESQVSCASTADSEA